MSRLFVGITHRGPSTLRNVSLSETGEPEVLLREGEASTLTLDYTEWLESGETISSAPIVAEQVTASIGTISTGATNLVVLLSNPTSYDDGKATITVTTTNGAVRKEVIRVRRPSLYGDEQYYRDYA